MIGTYLICWGCLQLFTGTFAQWTKPNARLPAFSDTYTVGEHIILSWLKLNASSNDLWLTRYSTTTDVFSLRLGTSVDISSSGSFDWTIAIDSEEVLADTRFVLQFLPTGAAYNASASLALSSPAFNLILVNQVSPPNGTVESTLPASTTASTSANQADQTTSPSSTPSTIPTGSLGATAAGLSQQTKVGIGIGAAGVTLVSSLILAVVLGKRRRARQRTKSETVEVKGPYEVLGDKRRPEELSSKETTIHELHSDRDNSVSEAGGSMIHEMATIVKKPGVHELPG